MCKSLIKSTSLSLFGIVGIGIILVMISSNIRWAKSEYWKSTIASDGRGYYAYLPAIFIYKDLNFTFFEKLDKEKYYDDHLYFDYRMPYKNQMINKYYCGTAIAQLPFFVAAHITTKIIGGEADGYSRWYQVFIGLAAIFWLLVGLFYLDKILLLYGISPWQRLVVLLAGVFGTNAFYYTLTEPAMSHIYSFAFVTVFIFYSKKYLETRKPVLLPILSALLAFIVLIRPINGMIVLALPFLAGDSITLKDAFSTVLKKTILWFFCIVIFLAIISIQCFLYKISVNEWWIYSYQNEGFNFSDPHIIDILFSYKKGLFLYTPLLFISLLGLFFLWRKSRFQTVSWILFFLTLTYVLSSWWQWYYGGSFSGRVYLEYVSLFMILLGIALRDIPFGWKKIAFVLVLFLLVTVCQIQTYQYRYYQIHWSDMTKERYWNVFLQP